MTAPPDTGRSRRAIPPVVLTYGVLGLAPSWRPRWSACFHRISPGWRPPGWRSTAALSSPSWAARAGDRGRRGPASGLNRHPGHDPDPRGPGPAAAPPAAQTAKLVGLAAALSFHLVWDLRSLGLPSWYAALRTLLTAGAVVGLVAGAVLLRG
uniref:Uncharacterized protein n=1 Tax=Phenylobacterium glaciei TaxID=2803784 RepID=A0A974P0P5_9CAUL|nr:hypothetical protein JKL49_13990 [Phenylobacterium glaciei]